MNTQTEPQESQELAVVETRALFLPQEKFPVMQQELQAMKPEIEAEITLANSQSISNAQDDDMAGIHLEKLTDRKKLVESKTKPFTSIAFKLHRYLTGNEGQYIKPIDAAITALMDKRKNWLEAERVRIEKLEADRQAEQDRRDQAERDRLLKEAQRLEQEAASAKRPDTVERKTEQAEALKEQAATVQSPVLHYERPRSSVGRNPVRKWKVTKHDMTAMGIPVEIQGYITVEIGQLERAKAANTMLNIKGVTFEHKLV